MINKLIVSMSPHIHSGDTVQKKMYNVVLALIPALIVSLYVFGIQALLVTVVSIVSCVIFEYLIQKYMLKGKLSIVDGSAILTGLLLAFNVPSGLPLWIVVLGALFAIGVGKMSFGGLGNNPFNPAIAGRIFMLISFPQQMTTWPTAFGVDATTAATPLAILKHHLGSLPSLQNLLLGGIGGSLGEVSALLLILGGLYLIYKKIITWHTPLSILLTIFLVTFFIALFFSDKYKVIDSNIILNALYFSTYHILAGGAMLGAIFMATDYTTSPMTKKGQIYFGIGIGIITVVIRLFGNYPEGMSFAIFIMNAVTPLINRYVKPTRFAK